MIMDKHFGCHKLLQNFIHWLKTSDYFVFIEFCSFTYFFSEIVPSFLKNSVFQGIYSHSYFHFWIMDNLILWFWDQTLKISSTEISVLNVSVVIICVVKLSGFQKTNLGIFLHQLAFFYTEFEDIGTRNLNIILIACEI